MSNKESNGRFIELDGHELEIFDTHTHKIYEAATVKDKLDLLELLNSSQVNSADDKLKSGKQLHLSLSGGKRFIFGDQGDNSIFDTYDQLFYFADNYRGKVRLVNLLNTLQERLNYLEAEKGAKVPKASKVSIDKDAM